MKEGHYEHCIYVNVSFSTQIYIPGHVEFVMKLLLTTHKIFLNIYIFRHEAHVSFFDTKVLVEE